MCPTRSLTDSWNQNINVLCNLWPPFGMLRSTTERACRREPCPQHQTGPTAWPSAHPSRETPSGVQGQAYQLLPKDSARHPRYPPMNSVRSFRAVQKPPQLHFIKHLLKMQLGQGPLQGRAPHKNILAWGPLACQVVTKNPSEVPSTGHWALWNTLEFTGS